MCAPSYVHRIHRVNNLGKEIRPRRATTNEYLQYARQDKARKAKGRRGKAADSFRTAPSLCVIMERKRDVTS